MKLYTEEQVRQAIKMADKYHHVLDSEENEIVSILEPIELPSDEEIDKEATYREPYVTRRAFFSGAKWMRNKIKQQQLLSEIMQADDKDGLYEDNMCIVCNGSGEGMYDGSTCSSCKGLGVKTKEL